MVKKYRESRGLSQEKLGRLAFDFSKSEKNKAQQKVKYIERAMQKWPRLDDIYLLAEALGVKVDDLLKND